jgi:hypothetical protein
VNLDLTQIKSLVEKDLFTDKLGSPPLNLPAGVVITQQQVWSTADPNIPFTMRDFRDMIAQCIYDCLSDTTSDGTALSVANTFGGGNKTAGTGIIKLQKGNTYISIDGTHIYASNGVTTVDLLTGGGGGGAVTSVFGRIGIVTAQTGDYTPAQVGAEPANANIQSHISSTSNPHNTTYTQVGAEPANANIQAHISSTSNPHSVTAAQVSAIAKTTNITALNETGIADGEIAVFNLTNKDIRTSDKTIVMALGADDTTVPTSKAVKDVTDTKTTVANLTGTAETLGGAADVGVATTAARSDHKHAITNPALDTLAAPTNNTTLDASTSTHGLVVKATAPAAGNRNVVGIDNAETAYTNKTLFDATNPAMNGSASPGSAMTVARRDHVHPTDTSLIAKATNVTSINDTGIADGEIAIFNLTNKDIRTSDKTIVTTLGADDTTVPTSKAVADVTNLKAPIASPTFTGTVTMPTGDASNGPLKMVSGTLLTVPVEGTIEFDGTSLYISI